jgi:Uma2 family endonuclease
MSAVFTPTTRKLTVDAYHALGETGHLGPEDRVELIEGEIIDMAPIGGAHMGVVNRLTRLLVNVVGDRGVVSIQNPVSLPPYSEPQPDAAILRPGADRLDAGIPRAADVLLLIEVADTTLVYDRGRKLALYAKHGIPELWVLNVPGKVLEIFRDPGPAGYATTETLGPDQPAIPSRLPGLSIAWGSVLLD